MDDARSLVQTPTRTSLKLSQPASLKELTQYTPIGKALLHKLFGVQLVLSNFGGAKELEFVI